MDGSMYYNVFSLHIEQFRYYAYIIHSDTPWNPVSLQGGGFGLQR